MNLDQDEDEARAKASVDGLDVEFFETEAFLVNAQTDMTKRMRDGERRGWGINWQFDYTDAEVGGRLVRAFQDLNAALLVYRRGEVGVDEVRKRAADVANQAFMMADPARLVAEPKG